jgi:hypothetical protein
VRRDRLGLRGVAADEDHARARGDALPVRADRSGQLARRHGEGDEVVVVELEVLRRDDAHAVGQRDAGKLGLVRARRADPRRLRRVPRAELDLQAGPSRPRR